MRFSGRAGLFAAFCVAFGVSSVAMGVPYASSVRDLDGGGAGTMFEFVLNEGADSVTVLRDGGNAVNFAAPAAGRYQFDMSGFSSYEIQVEKSAASGWTVVNGPGNPFANFSAATGIAINKDPSSPYFGVVYVGSSLTDPTDLGRPQALGIYPLTADLTGVDLTTFNAIADPNDTSQAKSPAGWGALTGGGVSPYRMTLDDGGNLIVGDWSDDTGGIKYASPDLTSGGLVLGGTDISGGIPTQTGPPGGVFADETDEFGRIPLHGSIPSKPYVTGTVGVDLTVWAQDEDLDVNLAAPNDDAQSLWRWDVGSATDYQALGPELVISSLPVQAAAGGTYAVLSVRTAAHYDENNDKWYLTQYRFNGENAGLLVVDADGTGPNLADPTNPNILWTSLDWTRDPNGDDNTSDSLDGFNGFGGTAGAGDGEDVFRLARDITTTADGTKLILHRIGEFGGNPHLGDGAVAIIPLDANGVPDLQLDDNGTPGDPSDDFLTNVETLFLTGNNDAHTDGNLVEFDIAGNLYAHNSAASGELLEVFSPGGNWRAITRSDGSFDLIPLAGGLVGDYNGDGTVDAADYVVWRRSDGEQQGYDDWRANFGMSQPGSGGGASGAIPEPSTLLLCLLSVGAVLVTRRR